MNEKLNELLQDESFIKNLLSLETDEEVQSFLSENGVDFTLSEIAAIKSGVAARLAGDEEELSDDDLENVAGGADIAAIISGICDGIGKIGDYIHKWTRGRW